MIMINVSIVRRVNASTNVQKTSTTKQIHAQIVQTHAIRAVSDQQTVVTALRNTVLLARYMLPVMHALQVLQREIQGSVSVMRVYST